MRTGDQQQCPEKDGSHGTTIPGQSRVGSPSEQTMATSPPASDNTFLRLDHHNMHADDGGSQPAVAGKKKRRGQRAVGGDIGLRQLSAKVLKKVESKGRTTRAEVADEIVAEFADRGNSVSSIEEHDDEKNIRRRVYDAFNVLMAMGAVSMDKREIQWKGLPRTSLNNDIEKLKRKRLELRSRIEKKAAHLQELEEKYVGLQNLIQRNEQLYTQGNAPNGGVSLPFILVQTHPHATVDMEISEDMQHVHFDFKSTPFELHDDNQVLKEMKFCETPQNEDITHNLKDGGEGSGMSGLDHARAEPDH